MSSTTKYVVFGPSETLKRMAPTLIGDIKPKHLYEYTSSDEKDQLYVAVYEEYEKQINASITVTCIIECTGKQNRFELVSTGGRMGFRGSSLSEEKTIENELIDYILDFAKRFGLTIQEQKPEEEEKEEKS